MRFGGILLVTLLLVGSCSDPEPKEPKSSPTSPTPTATAPTMPASAKKDTPSGAANFVRHYIDVFNYAANTGDVGPMQAIADDCVPCDGYAGEFTKLADKGDLVSGELWDLRGVAVSRTRSPLEVDADVNAREGTTQNPYTFTFVLSPSTPFRVKDIYMVRNK
jgi:hypothetical protein